jgi:hypothetical protein
VYGKIFERMFTGTMYGSGPVVFAVWAYVIACSRPPGVVSLNPKLLAATIGCSTEEIKDAIDFLMRPDAESATTDEDGRRLVHVAGLDYHVVSWQKYRDMRDEEERREYQRQWIADKRSRLRSTTADNAQHEPTAIDSDQPGSTKLDCRQMSTKSTKAEAEAEAVKKGRRYAPPARPKDVAEQTWADWLALRRSKKAPVTATVVAGAEAEAKKAGMSLDVFLREWLLRGSQGLKAEWLAQRGTDPPQATGRDGKPLPEWAIPGMPIL